MPESRPHKILRTVLFAITLIIPIADASAEPIYHPPGAKLTFGGMTQRSAYVSDMGNPAHAAVDPSERGSIGLSTGLGLEYDGNDNLFRKLDELSDNDAIDSGDSADSSTGSGSSSDPDLGALGPLLDDINNPEIEAYVRELAEDVVTLATFLLLSTEGLNAKAFISADAPVLISNDTLGGAWTFGINGSLTTRIRGLTDPIEFDVDTAIADLQAAYDASQVSSASQPTTIDLTGGLSVTIDPDTGQSYYKFQNNSGVITRAAQITEFSIGYSREVWQQEERRVTVGVRPRFINAGLSNAIVFVENIENTRTLFDSLDKSSFKYSNDISLDLGVALASKQYQVGLTLTNLNEPDFQFPEADLTGIDPVENADLIALIRSRETYTMESQLKIDAGVITADGSWGANFGLDLNAIPDPMRDDYQWLSVSGGYASDSWWLPGARLGLRKNLTGTELTYVTAGITAFKILNIDLASTLETVSINDKTTPRGLIANIGLQFNW